MKKNNLLTIAGAALLCVATWMAAPSETVVSVTVKGQDKAGKNCERVDPKGGSVFGKCERVCKDLEVVRDAGNKRWVCKFGVKSVRR
jgi:hypothetical protein